MVRWGGRTVAIVLVCRSLYYAMKEKNNPKPPKKVSN